MSVYFQDTLLIVGNGFDLTCGLRSRYIDFFNSCIRNYNHKSGIYSNYNANDEKHDFWQGLLYHKKWNSDDSNDYLWCDVELLIQNTLKIIFHDGNGSKEPLYKEVWTFVKNGVLQKKYLKNSEEEYIANYLTIFLHSQRLGGRKDIEDYEIANLIARFLLVHLKNLESFFCEFLNKQLVNPNTLEKHPTYGHQAAFLLHKLLLGIDIDVRNEEKTIRLLESVPDYNHLSNVAILSFNYTNPLDYVPLNLECTIANVHGKLCNEICQDCKKSSVIFGVDDKNVNQDQESIGANINRNNLRIFSKTYRLLQTGENIRNAIPLKNNLQKIKFFGHSLSDADYSYFQSIFDYYNIYDNPKLQLEFYYTEYDKQNIGRVKEYTSDAVYGLINEYGKTLPNKAHGKNLMHKLLLEKRISIAELTDLG